MSDNPWSRSKWRKAQLSPAQSQMQKITAVLPERKR